ncbi:unnamed protein product [Ceutorhynchus assimilis]|uniref:Alpha-and gamma-adaptin-binding protein p34 n=1 Tax=Ceutorhynchus assimilis TaxID=467358 RepID=A0A9N9MGV4_9CUCU|nr:unnamed protein product [Ceutorhynchus assimilis]
MMNDLPSILIVSSSNTKPQSIIKLLTKETPVEYPPGLFKQLWKIDTKYYSAIVNLIGMHVSYKRNEEFNKHIEALIIHMDSNKSTGLEELKQWEELETDCDPEIKLIIANYCNEDTKITKTEATEWCLNKGFELIELYPSDEQSIQNAEQDIIQEKFGIHRVVEALQAHTWSNLVMKKFKNNKAEKPDSPAEDLSEEDNFSELFSHLHMMKDSLQSLPLNQRKQCAEQMVSAFWNAIGGDEEELSDL